jgi:hypothetical protein
MAVNDLLLTIMNRSMANPITRRIGAVAAIAVEMLVPKCGAQQIIFSPQAVIGKKSKALQLWSVSGSVSASVRPPVAAVIYSLAAKHGIAYVDPVIATARLNARNQKSLAARVFQWGTYFETRARELVNLKVIATSSPVSIGLNVAMGITNALLPSVQKSIPVPDPNIAARIITASLLMDAQGSLSGMFWPQPSEVQGFVETLPAP